MRLFPVLLFTVALLIAGNAAYFSVKGIGLLFAGSFLSVVIMATSLEIGKLMAVSFIYRKWDDLRWMMKLYLSSAVFMLMAITSLGIYGFLSDAYQDTKTKVELYETQIVSIERENKTIQNQIDLALNTNKSLTDKSDTTRQTYQDIYDDLATRITKQIDSYNNQVAKMDQEVMIIQAEKEGFFSDKRGKINRLRDSQASEREFIKDELSKLKNQLDDEYQKFLTKVDMINNQQTVKIEEDDINELYQNITINNEQMMQLKQQIGDTDIGSFKFIANAMNVETDVAVKWFILAIVIVFDPLAVCLMIGYNMFVFKQPYEDYRNESIEKELKPSITSRIYKSTIGKILPAKTPRERQYYK